MAPRARLLTYWLAAPAVGGPLQVVPAPTVNIRNAANTANIADTIYAADDPDTVILGQGFLGNADGKIEAFLAIPQRVILRCSKTGFTTQDIPADAIFPANRYNPRGAWAAGTTYNLLDVVSNAGSSWVALRTNTGVTPIEGADWSLVASSSLTVQDEGVAQTQRATLNFTGAGVTATDDAANGRTNVAVKSIATDPIFDAAGDLVYGTAADTAARLAIGTAGQVLKVNAGATAPEWGAATASSFVGAEVSQSVAQSLANNTHVAIQFNVEDEDSNGFHDNVTNNTRITVPAGKAGRYLVIGEVTYVANATGFRMIRLLKNGSEFKATFTDSLEGSQSHTAIASRVVNLAVGDYVELTGFQDSGAALNTVANDTRASATHLSAVFLGA